MFTTLAICVGAGWIVIQLFSPLSWAMTSTTPADDSCFKNISVKYSENMRFTSEVKTTRKCGFFWWRRCTAYRTVISSKKVYKAKIKRVACNVTTPPTGSDPVTSGTQIPGGVTQPNSANGTGALSDGQDGEPTAGQMAGVIIGFIALAAVVVAIPVVVVVVYRRRKKRRASQQETGVGYKAPNTGGSSSALYYEEPEVIRNRKRLQQANWDGVSATNQNGTGDHVTEPDQSEYSYDHLRDGQKARHKDDSTDIALNTYGHLHGDHADRNGNEADASLYYNVVGGETTSVDSRAEADVPYDSLNRQAARRRINSNDGSNYDHVNSESFM